MNRCLIYTAGHSAALDIAIKQLQRAGLTFAEQPNSSVTHLLLPVPSPDTDKLNELLRVLPPDVQVIGGNLPNIENPAFDLLKDPAYVAENAYITAHCALRLVLDRLTTTLRNCPVLIIGWGRIGKCLGSLLKAMEADVTIAARKETDRGIISALGYSAVDTSGLSGEGYRVILNTVPVPVLPSAPSGCLKIDLASKPGIGGDGVLWARGLPGKDAPEASGKLIAETVMKYLRRECSA